MRTDRLSAVVVFFALSFSLLLSRLFSLHVLQHDAWRGVAAKQHELYFTLPPERGAILDRNGKSLASSKRAPSAYGVPSEVADPHKAALMLAPIFGEKAQRLEELLGKKKSFVWLKRHLSDEQMAAYHPLELAGVALRYESKRFYPQGELAAPLLGFCNIDEAGLEGIEWQYEKFLAGRGGFRRTKRDALGREIAAFDEQFVPAVNGHDVYLTIDQFAQFHTEQALKQAMEKWQAKAGTSVVMDVRTGEIMAMVSLPAFDANRYQEVSADRRRNRAITDYFEPGSMFKFVTASAALETKKFTLDAKIDCERGAYRVSRHTLHDVKPHDVLSFPEVFIKSSNIGAVKIAQSLGESTLYDWIRKFGFGELTGMDVPGEVEGVVRPPKDWSKLSISAIPIGHEVGVTAIQMVRAISAIANGGMLMRPYVIREVRSRDGALIESKRPVEQRRVVEPWVAEQVNGILIRVVTEGTGTKASIEGVAVAGKTGTAQKLTADGKTYSHDKYTSSFIGYAPADHPRFAMVVMVDEPHGAYYGGTVAAPVFKAVMQEILLQAGLLVLSKDPLSLTTQKKAA